MSCFTSKLKCIRSHKHVTSYTKEWYQIFTKDYTFKGHKCAKFVCLQTMNTCSSLVLVGLKLNQHQLHMIIDMWHLFQGVFTRWSGCCGMTRVSIIVLGTTMKLRHIYSGTAFLSMVVCGLIVTTN